jgi:hypothetical protein
MTTHDTHRPLCTLELIAEGRATRCPAGECAYWEKECVVARIEGELGGRPDVAGLLLEIRRELERARLTVDEAAVAHFHRRLASGCE